MPSFQPYNLLAVLGLAPQILTEVIWKLATHRTRPLRPEIIHVVTTAPGDDFVAARLHGDESRQHRHRPISHAENRWPSFCQHLFQDVLPAPFVHVVQDEEGTPLEDIRSLPDAEHAAAEVYRHVYRLTREDQPPLVAVLAGGRKTLGADLQTAFSVWARPTDRLVHVLVRPHTLEYDPDFYYPTSDQQDIDLVEVPVPRMRRLLERDPVLGTLVQHEGSLPALLAAVEPYNYATAPTRVRIHLSKPDPGSCILQFFSEVAEVNVHPMPPAETALLVTIAEYIAANNGASVSAKDLLSKQAAERREEVVLRAGGVSTGAWTKRTSLSQAVNRLKASLASLPMAQDFLTIEGDKKQKKERSDPMVYGWVNPAPPKIEVVNKPEGNRDWRALQPWPFNHIPLLDPEDLDT